MRRRRPDVDEELIPLEDDDAEPAPGGRIVELGPGGGNRRRDLGLLVGVVALVAAIGFLGDDGGQDERAEADATTTTTQRRTTTTPRRPRTTTTLPAEPIVTYVDGAGPVAPGTTTGSAIVSTDGDEIVVLDLDTGGRCRIEVPGRSDGLWIGRGIGARAHVNGNRGAYTVTSGCELSGPRQQSLAELLPSERPDHVWELRHEGIGVQMVEVALDGTPSGREIRLPVWSGALHPVAGGFVTDVFGSVTFVDAATGQGRELADGITVAAAGDLAAVLDCDAFDCELVVLDLAGRQVLRRASDRPALGWHGGALSPDGRWLVHLVAGEAGVPSAVLVDLATGAERDLGRSDGGSFVYFTATSSHVAVRTTRGLDLVPVGGGEPIDLDALTPRSQPFAVIDRR